MDLPCVQDRESPSISEANSLDDICFPTDEHEDDNISSPSSSFSRQNKRRRDVLASYRVFEFIEELSILLKLFQDKYNQLQEVAETYYIPLCQSFAQMCHLKVQYGRPTKWINLADQKIVSSVPDLCFFQKGKQLDELVLSKSQILVSVVEVKKDSRQKCEEPPIKIGKCSDEKDEGSCRPEILKDLTESVLGQHAGELLLEIRRKDHVTKVENGVKKFMKPGMVVDGTKVYFTILKMSDNHIEELEKKKKYDDSMDEATIYYAKPLDLLFKEDRDILIDSFMMLNNIDFS
ncbi:uncharacterized protein LOC143051780 isoform X2 [Mytilus galloprovincialis]|uniref:uncharacterized protein LOC143051780 isoform X2 n=1 Tax=Mytilus galloprovincialis TaxID=29158 RepID=UPI003F7C8BBC